MTAPPDIPDHELLRLIGRGAYGEVWLARNVMGIMRAVKVVRRSSFENERPFAREFAAVKRYEPVSRAAAGLVNVLHAGRAADDALFYYIMELADSAVPGVAAADEPEKFVPCTLRTQIGRMGRMPVAECLEVAVSLANGIADLHRMGLVHRDVKPSNIIFVNGRAKLADIGLLGDITESRSYVGTEGYVPPEGPGQPNADIFALGRVLYEMATGYEATRFPALPPEWAQQGQAAAFEFYEIVLKCCEPDAARRYHTADDLLADLALLQSGQSVRQVRQMRGRLAVLRRVAAAAAVVGLLATAGFFVAQRQAAQEKSLRERAEHAERAAVDARWEALCAHTRAARRDITAGAVTAALKAAREAGALRTSAELRSDAAFLLGRPDLTPRVAPELADRIGKQFISLDLERRRWLHLPYGMNTPPEQRRGTASWRALDSAAATPWPDSFTAAHSWNFITSSDYQWLVDVSAAKGVWNVTTFAPPAALPPVVVQGWPQPTTRGVIIRARPPGDLVWFEAASGAEQRHVSVPDWNAQEISASPDGASIVLYEKERGLACVDGTSGSVRWRIVMPRAAWPPVWSPDGARLFIMEGSAARVLDAATGVRRSVPDGLWELGGAEFCFAASRHLLVSTSWGNVTWLHDITRGVPLLRVPDGGRAPVFSSSQKLLGLHQWSFFGARLYDWHPRAALHILGSTGKPECLAFTPDECRLASAETDACRWWSLDPVDDAAPQLVEKQEKLLALLIHPVSGQATLFPPAGPVSETPAPHPLAPGITVERAAQSADGTVRAYCASGPCAIWRRDSKLPPLPSNLRTETVAVSPDGRRVATTCYDGPVQTPSVMLWNVEAADGAPLMVHNFAFPAKWLAFSPDGHWLSCAGVHETIVFDLASYAEAARWPRTSAGAGGYTVFSPDGEFIAHQNTLEDFTLRRTGTWEHVLTLKSPAEEQLVIPVFSPRGRWLAAAGARGEIYLWDLKALAAGLTEMGLGWR